MLDGVLLHGLCMIHIIIISHIASNNYPLDLYHDGEKW